MNREYFTVDQISNMLDIHPKTVQRYIREGRLRATKIGKSWRVAGHDLSVFVEHNHVEGSGPETRPARRVIASSVIDISVDGKEDAIRIMNTLTAALNVKPPEFGQSTMHSQYIEREDTVRVTLWGPARFMAVMMDMIAALAEQDNEE